MSNLDPNPTPLNFPAAFTGFSNDALLILVFFMDAQQVQSGAPNTLHMNKEEFVVFHLKQHPPYQHRETDHTSCGAFKESQNY